MIFYIPELAELHLKAIEALKKNNHKIIVKKNLNKIEQAQIQVLFIRSSTKANKDYLQQFPNLKFILRAGVGLDNIDLGEAKKKNIKVINAPGSNSNSVAELVIYFILTLLRNIKQQDHRLRNGLWREIKLLGQELKNKSIGLIGCGAVGKSVAEKIMAFKVKEILGYDPYLDKETLAVYKIKKVTLNYLIKNSDIISLHLPLTKETKDLITLKEIKLMDKKSYIINTSRGGIINENDLIVALKNKIIAGAALDVFKNEPNFNPGFLSLDNVILTPHIGAYTHEADLEMSMVPVKKFLSLTK